MSNTRNKGAIRSSLSTISTTAEAVEIAVQIVKVNLQVMLEEELYEVELRRHELAQRRDLLTKEA